MPDRDNRKVFMMNIFRLGFLCCVFAFVFVHCGSNQNTCSSGNVGFCTCPDGSQGERKCLSSGTFGACYCKVSPPPTRKTEGSKTEPSQEPTKTESAPEPRPEPSVELTPEPTKEPIQTEPSPEPSVELSPEPSVEPQEQDAGPPEQPIDQGNKPCSPACGKGATCQGGSCACANGEEYCQNYCADTRYDPNHCGACGRICKAEQACVDKQCQCFYSKLIHTEDMGCNYVVNVAMSPDGKYTAGINMNGGSGCGADLTVWDTKTRKLVLQLKKQTYKPSFIKYFPDNDLLFMSGGRRVKWYSTSQKKYISYADSPSRATVIELSGDPTKGRQYVAMATTAPSFSVVNMANRKTVKSFKTLPGRPNGLMYRPDGKRLAVGFSTKELWIYDTTSWATTQKITLPEGVKTLAYSKDGKLVGVGMGGNKIAIVDAAAGTIQRTITFNNTFTYEIYDVEFSADGKYIFSSWGDRSIKVHDVSTGSLVHTIAGMRFAVLGLAVSPDGKYVISGSGKKVEWWGCGN